MITLITGTPGSGKSLRAVYLITQALADNRPVYTDIDGINFDGVFSVDIDHDWRDTPEGSLVVYDEVQRRWPSTGKPGQAPQEDIRALETHRHTGHDLIIITQHPTLVHHHVRKLVGEHVHVRRVSGAKVVSLFTMSEVFDPKDKGELRHADKTTFKYPKDLFVRYKSATAHTHKFSIPAKIKWLGGFLVILFSVIVYLFFTMDFNDSPASDVPPRGQSEAAPAAERPLPMAHPDYSPPVDTEPVSISDVSVASSSPVIPHVAGCVKFASRCSCYSSDGLSIDVTYSQCELLLSDMPRDLEGYRSGGSSSGDSSSDYEEVSSDPPMNFEPFGVLPDPGGVTSAYSPN